MAVEYFSEQVYCESATSLKDKIDRIDKIIDGLLKEAENNIGKAPIESYSLDDGQTKISSTYKSSDAMRKAAMEWEAHRNYLVNKLNGRKMMLRGPNSFPRR